MQHKTFLNLIRQVVISLFLLHPLLVRANLDIDCQRILSRIGGLEAADFPERLIADTYNRPLFVDDPSHLAVRFMGDQDWHHAVSCQPEIVNGLRVARINPFYRTSLAPDVKLLEQSEVDLGFPHLTEQHNRELVYRTFASQAVATHGLLSYTKFVAAVADFTTWHFTERRVKGRSGWSPELLAHLSKVTKEYGLAANYVVVTDPSNPGRILGVVRLIRIAYEVDTNGDSPYHYSIEQSGNTFGFSPTSGTLVNMFYRPDVPRLARDDYFRSPQFAPMEPFLDIGLFRGIHNIAETDGKGGFVTSRAGQIFEVGNFVIDHTLPKKLRDQIYVELLIGLLDTVYTSNFTTLFQWEGQRFYTYADEASLHLYEPLGFRRMTDRPIERYNVDWWPLKMHGDGFARLKDRLPDIKKLRPDQIDRLRSFKIKHAPLYEGEHMGFGGLGFY